MAAFYRRAATQLVKKPSPFVAPAAVQTQGCTFEEGICELRCNETLVTFGSL